jgi:hypothetical protein
MGESDSPAPTTLVAIGAISSYLLFAAGWALFGIAKLPGSGLSHGDLRRHRDRRHHRLPSLPVAHRHPPWSCRRMARLVDDAGDRSRQGHRPPGTAGLTGVTIDR